MKKTKNFGFTLVELLIVIALISVLAVALIATLNPIEQVNKARDSRFKNDAAEVLAGVERYYATQMFYPWSDEFWGEGAGAGDDEDLGLTSLMPGMGICYGDPAATLYDTPLGAADACVTADDEGQLIDTDELKPAFANKEPFPDGSTAVEFDDKLYLWREGGSSSIFICFVPKANSNRQITSGLKDLAIAAEGGVPSQIADATQVQLDAALWANETNSLYICVPE